MKIVGLTGGSGTGKSTVARHLARRPGTVVVDADALGHAVLEDAAVRRRVREAFGDDVFDVAGRVDRARLGARVFSDARVRRRLEAIVHPEIVRRTVEAVEAARRAGARLVVVDAALLLEVDLPLRFDLVLALRAPRDVCRRRLLERDDRSPEAVERRLDAQRELEKSFVRADAIVDTDRALPDVLAEVDRRVDGLFSEGDDSNGRETETP